MAHLLQSLHHKEIINHIHHQEFFYIKKQRRDNLISTECARRRWSCCFTEKLEDITERLQANVAGRTECLRAFDVDRSTDRRTDRGANNICPHREMWAYKNE
ncbi:hypothetical protein LOTGIDRAFT_173223 [Lottia gigantea]|uniref:Uncharacterized protein n=1 Tax=Lottia gigantea TaxID=225164 RepID=V4CEJ9_LOTGI|nr:hypothetical protein LOTGIDRAFT_173223 [Lottia gigantea]ESP00370.1 hypothetical protein LOTGIDRAFT_173223 [Lottia gigantea]